MKEPAAQLLDIMEYHGAVNNAPTVTIARIISVEPLAIQMGKLQIDKDNIFISTRLIPEYKRAYQMEGTAHLKYTPTFANTNPVVVGNHGAHSHIVKEMELTTEPDDFTAKGGGDKDHCSKQPDAPGKYLTYKDYGFKIGDQVLVIPTTDSQMYIIVDVIVRIAEVIK